MGYMKIRSVNDLENVIQIPWDDWQNYYWSEIWMTHLVQEVLKKYPDLNP